MKAMLDCIDRARIQGSSLLIAVFSATASFARVVLTVGASCPNPGRIARRPGHHCGFDSPNALVAALFAAEATTVLD